MQQAQPIAPDFYHQATPDMKQQADSMINSIDPTGLMDQNTHNAIKNAFLSNDPAQMQAILSANNLDVTKTSNFINAYRTTRDTSLQENQQNAQVELQNQRTLQQYDTAIAQQQLKVKQDANNMSVMQDSAGRLQSQNMGDAISAEMGQQQQILSNLQQSKNWALGEIATNAQYNHTVLANTYNDQMSKYSIELQDQIKNLSDTGLAKTANGLAMAQSAVDKNMNNRLALGQIYAQQLQSATDQMKMHITSVTPNVEQTQLINDGLIHNATGGIVT